MGVLAAAVTMGLAACGGGSSPERFSHEVKDGCQSAISQIQRGEAHAEQILKSGSRSRSDRSTLAKAFTSVAQQARRLHDRLAELTPPHGEADAYRRYVTVLAEVTTVVERAASDIAHGNGQALSTDVKALERLTAEANQARAKVPALQACQNSTA